MGFAVNAQIVELRAILGVDANDTSADGEFRFDDNGCLLLLNRAWWALMDTFQFREKEKTAQFQTVAGTDLYAVPQPFEGLRQISIEDINDQSHTPLNFMTPVVYESKFVDTVEARDKPSDYVREGNSLRLYPTPDDIYTMTIKYWFPLDDLVENVSPPVPQIWHEIILYGAASRGYMILQDQGRAFSTGAYQDTLLGRINPTEGKEERDTRYAALAVKRNDRQ